MHLISDWITVSNGSEVFTEDKSSIESPIVFWKLMHFNPIRTEFISTNLIYPNLFLESQLPETHLSENSIYQISIDQIYAAQAPFDNYLWWRENFS